jgi:DNA-binding MarR family transcriptional regulator
MEGLSREEATVQFAHSGYNLDEHPAHLVRRVHQRATQQFQQVMEGDNLSPTQFAALATILKNGAISQNHLGRLTSMDPSTISVVVRNLLAEGLVKRVKSETDQRLTILTLSDQGQAYTLERLKKSVEVGKRLLAPLTAAEQAVLMSMLRRLCDDEAIEAANNWDVAPARGDKVGAAV